MDLLTEGLNLLVPRTSDSMRLQQTSTTRCILFLVFWQNNVFMMQAHLHSGLF